MQGQAIQFFWKFNGEHNDVVPAIARGTEYCSTS